MNWNTVESRVIPLLASPPRSASAIARSIKQRRGGRAIKKISRSSADREAGVVFRWMQKENHPGCVRFGRYATFFLMTQPPLLCLMLRAIPLALRGGDARKGVALPRLIAFLSQFFSRSRTPKARLFRESRFRGRRPAKAGALRSVSVFLL